MAQELQCQRWQKLNGRGVLTPLAAPGDFNGLARRKRGNQAIQHCSRPRCAPLQAWRMSWKLKYVTRSLARAQNKTEHTTSSFAFFCARVVWQALQQAQKRVVSSGLVTGQWNRPILALTARLMLLWGVADDCKRSLVGFDPAPEEECEHCDGLRPWRGLRSPDGVPFAHFGRACC